MPFVAPLGYIYIIIRFFEFAKIFFDKNTEFILFAQF